MYHFHAAACPAGHHDNLNATGVYRTHQLNFGLSTDDPASYFGNVTMPQVEELVKRRLGFTNADVAQAHRNAYRARFAPHAARIVAAARKSADGTLALASGSASAADGGKLFPMLLALWLVGTIVGVTCCLAALRSWLESRSASPSASRYARRSHVATTSRSRKPTGGGELPPELTTVANLEVM
jgi:hypothetical protein